MAGLGKEVMPDLRSGKCEVEIRLMVLFAPNVLNTPKF